MTSEQNDFLKLAVPAAQYTERTYGVPASITVAQAILESGWGASELARECNNFFGVKASHNAAPDSYQEFPTTEFVDGHAVPINAAFAKYPSVTMSFAGHARLIAIAPRYKPAMAARTNAEQFAQRLQACGYSSNPRYAESLMALVREFDLTQYDTQPDPPAAQAVAA